MTFRIPISSDGANGHHIRCYAHVASGGIPPICRFSGVIRRSEFNPAWMPNPWANPVIAKFAGRCVFRPSPNARLPLVARLSAVVSNDVGRCLLHVRATEATAIVERCRATIRLTDRTADLYLQNGTHARCDLPEEHGGRLLVLTCGAGSSTIGCPMAISCPITSIGLPHAHALNAATERSEIYAIDDDALNAALATTLAFQIVDGVLRTATG